MNFKRKLSCFLIFLLFFGSFVALFRVGVLKFEVFGITGKVLETTDPNIYYVYTNFGTNEYNQQQDNYETISKEYQTNGTHHMFTIGSYPTPGDTVNYLRLKFYIKWPVYEILWLNFVY